MSALDQTSRHRCHRLKYRSPEPPLPSNGRVLPCVLVVRVDEVDQNLDKRHVHRSSSPPPSRYVHTASCRRSADRLKLLRRSNISSIGKGVLRVPERRCVALRRQERVLFFETVKNRRLVDPDLLCPFTGAFISCLSDVPLARFHLREIFNAQEQYNPKSFLSQTAVDSLLVWRNFSIKSPENLQEL